MQILGCGRSKGTILLWLGLLIHASFPSRNNSRNSPNPD